MNVASSAQTIVPISVGDSLPNATLQTMEGGQISLQDALQNKAGILIFYRGSW